MKDKETNNIECSKCGTTYESGKECPNCWGYQEYGNETNEKK
ncbi:hypothetical protein [Aureivirga marina]|nr:hypothetical protein [Aureivirga marina]